MNPNVYCANFLCRWCDITTCQCTAKNIIIDTEGGCLTNLSSDEYVDLKKSIRDKDI